MVSLSLTSKHFNIFLKVSFFGSASCFWLIFVKYKEQQILDKICKVTQQKQISYFDFVPFFDFQYEKIIFNCQPSHFSPCSAVPAHSFASLTREILFLPLEHKIHIFSPPCNILYLWNVLMIVLFFEILNLHGKIPCCLVSAGQNKSPESS